MRRRAKKEDVKKLKQDARDRFERFIATELDVKPDVETTELAIAFYDKERSLLQKIANSMMIGVLVKWADDILGNSISNENAENGRQQLELPFDLQGIDVPGALSFISGANKFRFVANYKATWVHVDSHAFLMKKRDEEMHAARVDFDRLRDAVQPIMQPNPILVLPDALRRLIDFQ